MTLMAAELAVLFLNSQDHAPRGEPCGGLPRYLQRFTPCVSGRDPLMVPNSG